MASKGFAHLIVQDFLRVAAKFGRSPSRAEYLADAERKFSPDQITEYFKNWLGLVRAAGMVTPQGKRYEDPTEPPKILVLDLEVFPMLVYTYGLYDQNIGVKQIVEHSSLASFAGMFLDSEEIFYQDVSRKKNKRDDRELSNQLLALMNSADVIIGQNSNSFDVKVAEERFFFHDLGPSKPVRLLDTKVMSKKKFRFPSYSLEYMGRYTGEKKLTDRKFQGMQLQIECLNGNPEAWEEMRTYNIQDVKATMAYYKRIAPYHGHELGSMQPGISHCCPSPTCGSQNIIQRGWKYLASGKFKQYTCNDCGRWFHDSGAANNVLSPIKRASLKGPVR